MGITIDRRRYWRSLDLPRAALHLREGHSHPPGWPGHDPPGLFAARNNASIHRLLVWLHQRPAGLVLHYLHSADEQFIPGSKNARNVVARSTCSGDLWLAVPAVFLYFSMDSARSVYVLDSDRGVDHDAVNRRCGCRPAVLAPNRAGLATKLPVGGARRGKHQGGSLK